MGFADDANALIQEKKFDDLESLWMNQLESDPKDVDAFLRTAKLTSAPLVASEISLIRQRPGDRLRSSVSGEPATLVAVVSRS